MKKFLKPFWCIIFLLVIIIGIAPKFNDILKNQKAHAASAFEFTTESTTQLYYDDLEVTTTKDWFDGFITTSIDLNDPRETTTVNYNDDPTVGFVEYTTIPTTTYHNESTTYNNEPSDDWCETTTSVSNMITAIYIPNLTYIADYDGYWDYEYYWDEVKGDCYLEYYRYNTYPQEITVIYADGTRFTGNPDEVYAETGYWLNYTDNQSYDNQWTIGDYYISASLGHARTTFKVSIIDTPIENIEIEINKIKLIENIDGYLSYYFDENGQLSNMFFKYDVWINVNEITFKDGFEHYEDYYSYSITDDQSYETPWGVGKHTITFTCLGYEEDFEVEVVSNPNKVVNISASANRKLVEGFDGYVTSDYIFDENTQEYEEVEYYQYFAELSHPIFTIEFEDGTVVSGTDSQVYKQTGIYPSIITYQSINDPWKVGVHTAYIEFSNKLIPYQLEITSCPVSKIEFIKTPVKTEYIVGEYPDLKGAIVRIHYISGEFADVPLNEYSVSNGNICFDTQINNSCYLEVKNNVFENLGSDSIVVTYGQFSCEYPVSVVENIIDKIIISNSDSNELLINVYNSDGTAQLLKVIAFEANSSDENGTFEMYGGYLYTDNGIFYSIIYAYHNGLYFIELQNDSNGQMIQSNKLDDCKWIELFIKCYKIDINLINCNTKSFNGELNKDNVDEIVSLSLITNIREIDLSNRPFYSANDVVKAIKNSFVVNNIDLSLSSNYNSADDTIKAFIDGGGAGFIKPHKLEYKDGYWFIEMSYFINEPTNELQNMYIIFDDELRIVAFGTDKIPNIEKPNVSIKQPSQTVISYGDCIILHVDTLMIPQGGYVEWTTSNGNFDIEVSADGSACKITPSLKGDTTFTVTIYDKNGKVVSADDQTMTSKAGFFDKIIAFFKRLFGLTKTIPQVFKGVI